MHIGQLALHVWSSLPEIMRWDVSSAYVTVFTSSYKPHKMNVNTCHLNANQCFILTYYCMKRRVMWSYLGRESFISFNVKINIDKFISRSHIQLSDIKSKCIPMDAYCIKRKKGHKMRWLDMSFVLRNKKALIGAHHHLLSCPPICYVIRCNFLWGSVISLSLSFEMNIPSVSPSCFAFAKGSQTTFP